MKRSQSGKQLLDSDRDSESQNLGSAYSSQFGKSEYEIELEAEIAKLREEIQDRTKTIRAEREERAKEFALAAIKDKEQIQSNNERDKLINMLHEEIKKQDEDLRKERKEKEKERENEIKQEKEKLKRAQDDISKISDHKALSDKLNRSRSPQRNKLSQSQSGLSGTIATEPDKEISDLRKELQNERNQRAAAEMIIIKLEAEAHIKEKERLRDREIEDRKDRIRNNEREIEHTKQQQRLKERQEEQNKADDRRKEREEEIKNKEQRLHEREEELQKAEMRRFEREDEKKRKSQRRQERREERNRELQRIKEREAERQKEIQREKDKEEERNRYNQLQKEKDDEKRRFEAKIKDKDDEIKRLLARIRELERLLEKKDLDKAKTDQNDIKKIEDNYKQQIQQLNNQIRQLKGQITDKDEEIRQLQEDLDHERNKNKVEKRQIDEKRKWIQDKEKELDNKQLKLDDTEFKQQETEELQKEENKQIDAKKLIILLGQKQLDEREKMLKDREKLLNDKEAQLKDREKKLARDTEDLKWRENHIKDKEKELDDKEKKLQQREKDLRNKERDLDEQKFELQKKQTDLNDKLADLMKLQADLAAKQRDQDKITEQQDRRNNLLAQNEQKLRDKQDELQRKLNEIELREEDLKDREDEIDKLSGPGAGVTAKDFQDQEKLQKQLKLQNDQLKKDNDKLEAQIAVLQSKIKQKQDEISKLNQEIDRLQSENDNLKQQNGDLVDKNQDLQIKLDDIESQQRMDFELREWKKKNPGLDDEEDNAQLSDSNGLSKYEKDKQLQKEKDQLDQRQKKLNDKEIDLNKRENKLKQDEEQLRQKEIKFVVKDQDLFDKEKKYNQKLEQDKINDRENQKLKQQEKEKEEKEKEREKYQKEKEKREQEKKLKEIEAEIEKLNNQLKEKDKEIEKLKEQLKGQTGPQNDDDNILLGNNQKIQNLIDDLSQNILDSEEIENQLKNKIQQINQNNNKDNDNNKFKQIDSKNLPSNAFSIFIQYFPVSVQQQPNDQLDLLSSTQNSSTLETKPLIKTPLKLFSYHSNIQFEQQQEYFRQKQQQQKDQKQNIASLPLFSYSPSVNSRQAQQSQTYLTYYQLTGSPSTSNLSNTSNSITSTPNQLQQYQQQSLRKATFPLNHPIFDLQTDILPVESEKGPFYVQNTPLIRIQALAACYFDPNHVISKISIAILAKKMSLIEPDFRKQLKSTGILAEYTQLLRNSLIKEEKIRLWQVRVKNQLMDEKKELVLKRGNKQQQQSQLNQRKSKSNIKDDDNSSDKQLQQQQKQQSTRLEQLKTEQKAISFMFDQNVNEIEQICVTIKVLIEDVDEMIQEGIDEGLVNLLLERLNEINEYKQKIIAKRIQVSENEQNISNSNINNIKRRSPKKGQNNEQEKEKQMQNLLLKFEAETEEDEQNEKEIGKYAFKQFIQLQQKENNAIVIQNNNKEQLSEQQLQQKEEQEIDDLIDVDIEMSRIVVPPILIYVLCPFSGTTNANKKLLIECGMLQGLIPLVWSRNKDMQSNILDSIFNLVVGGSNITKESDPHPYYKICEKEKLIDKLLLVCEREKLEEQINNEKFNEEMQFLKDERNRLLSESGNNSKDNKNKLNDDESDNQNEQIDDEMSGMEIRATSTFIISFIMRHQKLEQKHERIIDILKTLLEKCCSFEKKEEMQNYLELRNKRRKQLDTLRKQKEQVRENDQQDPYSSISLKRRDVYSYTTQIPNNVNQLGYNQQQQQQTQNPDMQQQLKKALRKSKNPQSQTGLIPSSAFSSSNSDDLTYQQQSGSIKRNQLRTRNQYFGQPISDQLGLNLDNDSQQQSMSNTISSISPRSRSPRLFTVTQQFNNQYTQPLLSSSSFNNNNNNTSLLPQSDSSLNYGSNLNNRYDFQSQFTTPMTTMSKQQAKQLNDLKQKLQATRQLRDGMTQTSAQNSLRPNTANTNIQQPYQQYNSQNQDPIRATQSLNFGQPSGLDQQYIQNTQQQQQWLMQNFNVWQGSGKDLVWMTKTALSSLRYLAMEVANHTYFIDDLMLETLDKMLIIWSFRASPPIESQTKDDDEDEDEKKEKKRNAEQVLNKLLCTIEIILIKGNAQTKRMIISLAKRTDDENNQNDDDDDEDQRNKGKQNKPRKFKSRPKWETLITKHLKADSIELKQVSKIILKKLSGDDSDSDDEDEDEKKEQTAIGEPQGEGDEDDDYDDDDEEDDEVVDAGGKKKNDDEDDDDDF